MVHAAAHRMLALYSFDFQVDGDFIRIDARPKAGFGISQESFAASFRNELLDQQLRQTIAVETKTERDLILAHAFSNTKLIS